MPLIFSAVVPNHPEIAKELAMPGNVELSPTAQSIKELEGELYFMKPDTIVILTSHGSIVPDLINMNISGTVAPKWPEGMTDMPSDATYTCDVEFMASIKGKIDTKDLEVPLTIIAEPSVVPEVAGPLSYLMSHLESTKVVVMSTADFSLQEHYLFGEFLADQIMQTNKRVAVFATGHLSSDSAKAEHEKKTFDSMCLECLKENRREEILRLNNGILKETDADIVIPLSVMLGIIAKVNISPEVLSYEQTYGFGQLVANFVIK
ncbi:MAG: hypothetical protein ABIG66_04620 [Candidatus Kerfeldbacteria bacterium]